VPRGASSIGERRKTMVEKQTQLQFGSSFTSEQKNKKKLDRE
jgi:hypothetical protein